MRRRDVVSLLALASLPAYASIGVASARHDGESQMELFLFARLYARAGNAEAVRQAIHDVQGATRSEPGCLDYHAFQSVQDMNEFYIHSRWKTRSAFDSHVAQSHTISFVARVEPLIDAPLKPVLARLLA